MVDLSIKCLICGSTKISCIWKSKNIAGDKSIIWCSNCGFGWQHPYPTIDEVHSFYNDDALSYVIQNEREKKEGFKHRIIKLSKLVPERGKLLDVGSGLGHFLSMAQDDGWQVEGVEIQKSAARYSQEHFGIEPHIGDMEQLSFNPESFDVVTLWDVLEHSYMPLDLLSKCNELVKPGGLVVLAVPNASGWPAHIFKGGWRYVMPHHLSYFSIGCMERIISYNKLTLENTNHTIKVQSLLQGLESLFPWAIRSEQLMRLGRNGSIEHNHLESVHIKTGSRINRVKKNIFGIIRSLAFKINLTPLRWPIGDLMDFYCRKNKGRGKKFDSRFELEVL